MCSQWQHRRLLENMSARRTAWQLSASSSSSGPTARWAEGMMELCSQFCRLLVPDSSAPTWTGRSMNHPKDVPSLPCSAFADGPPLHQKMHVPRHKADVSLRRAHGPTRELHSCSREGCSAVLKSQVLPASSEAAWTGHAGVTAHSPCFPQTAPGLPF